MKYAICSILLASLLSLGPPSTLAGALTGEVGTYYEDAQRRYQDNEIEAAAIQLKNALQINPQHLPSLLLMGNLLLEQKLPSAAEHYLSRALNDGADLALVGGKLAQTYLLSGEYGKIITRLDANRLQGEARAELLAYHAEAYLGLGRMQLAEEALVKARAASATAVRPGVVRVNLLLQQGKFDDALERGKTLVSLYPDNAEAWTVLASTQHVRGALEDALDSYGKALAIDEQHLNTRIARAGLLIDLSRDTEAMADLDYLKQEYPNEPQAGYMRALLQSRAGQSELAKETLNETINLFSKLEPAVIDNDRQLSLTAALTYHGAGQWEQSRKHLQAYLQQQPLDTGARKLMGDVLLKLGEPREALKVLDPIYRDNSRDVSLLTTVANAYSALGDHRRATRALEQAANVATDNTSIQTRLAISQLSAGKIDQGLEGLSGAFQKDQSNQNAGFNLAIQYMKLNQNEQAIPVIERLIETDPENLTYLNLLGIAHSAQGELAKARLAFETTLRYDSNFLPAQINLAKLELADGDVTSAREQLLRLNEQHPENGRILLELSKVAKSQGKLDDAVTYAEQARRKRASTSTLLYLGELFIDNRQLDRAEEIAWQAEQTAPEDLNVLKLLARVLILQGETDNARAILKRMVLAANFDQNWLRQIADTQAALGLMDDAKYTLYKATQAREPSRQTRSSYIDLLIRMREFGPAEELIQEIIAADPDSADGYALLGKRYSAAQEYQQALEYFNQAIERQPDSSGLALMAYAEMLKLGQVAAAGKRLQQWLQQRPEDDELQAAYAEHLLRTGNIAEARQIYTRLIEDYPENASLNNNLAHSLHKLGERDAERYARKAVELQPDNALYNDTLGWILVTAGQHEEGLVYIREASVRASQNPEIRYHLAYTFHQLGREAEARRELQTALKSRFRFDGRDQARSLLERLQ